MNTVLHIIDHIGGGKSESFLLKLYKNRHMFHNIKPIFYSMKRTEFDPPSRDDLIISSNSSKWNPFVLIELIKLVKDKEVKLIHLHLPKAILLGILLKLITAKDLRVIVHEHGEIFEQRGWYIFFMKFGQKLVDRFIAVSELTKEELIKAGIKKQKIAVINNFINFDNFNFENQDKFQNREKYNLPKDKLVLGYLGRLVKMKNVDAIIKAIAKLKAQNKEVYLLIIGDGPERDTLERLVWELEIKDSVRFLGYRTKISSLISTIDIGCLVSEYESFGLPILEFLSMKRQVILTKVGISREVKKYVKIVEKHNLAEKIAKAVIELRKNPKPKISEKKLNKKYSPKSYFSKLENLYIRLI